MALLIPLLACSPSDEPDSPESDASSTDDASTRSSAPPSDPADALPPVHHRPSLPALMRVEDQPERLRVERVEARTPAYTRSQVTYRSGGLTVSGVLLRPEGEGPFPAIVLNHGYIEPSVYTTGQGLAREQDWLARAGFVVLHTDYRGHASSDPASALSRESRIGYARDAINAVRALKQMPYVDDERLAMLGRSMGGAVTMNALVAKPGLVDAAVLYASVSSDVVDNLRRWTIPERPGDADRIFDRFGRPGEADGFYADLSARSYFDRITEPVLMFHGTADDSCPVRWARTTQQLMQEAGVDSQLVVYPGEEHAFVPRWEHSIRRTVRFIEAQW